MTRRILVPLDGSENALKSLDFTISIADKYDDILTLLYVVPDRDISDEVKQYMQAEHIKESPQSGYEGMANELILGEGERRAKENHISSVKKIIEYGKPAQVITRAAERENVDMIIMGTRGLSNIESIALGSTAHKVMHLANCTVVVVK
jgi:nucleotide-binding universal stress UspA family protein